MPPGDSGVTVDTAPLFQIIVLPTRVPFWPLLQTIELPFCVQTVCARAGIVNVSPNAIAEVMAKNFMCSSPSPSLPAELRFLSRLKACESAKYFIDKKIAEPHRALV
jgi:hypothetical protein